MLHHGWMTVCTLRAFFFSQAAIQAMLAMFQNTGVALRPSQSTKIVTGLNHVSRCLRDLDSFLQRVNPIWVRVSCRVGHDILGTTTTTSSRSQCEPPLTNLPTCQPANLPSHLQLERPRLSRPTRGDCGEWRKHHFSRVWCTNPPTNPYTVLRTQIKGPPASFSTTKQ